MFCRFYRWEERDGPLSDGVYPDEQSEIGISAWNKPNDILVTGYLLEYFDSNKPEKVHSFTFADTNSVALKNLPFGHSYRFRLASLTSSGNHSEFVSTSDVAFISRLHNNNPSISSFDSEQLIGYVWQKISLPIKAVDVDGDVLVYFVIEAPADMKLGMYNGTLEWTPGVSDIGNHNCKVATTDNKGGIDTLEFNLAIRNPLKASVKIDRLYYAPEASIAQIKVYDQNENKSMITTEEVSVEIDTKQNSFLYKAIESSGNSSYFSCSVDLSKLNLFTNDSVTVMYKNGNGEVFSDYAIWQDKLMNIDQQDSKIIPTEYKLFQNFPNPFNPNTTIKYSIPRASLVNIKIYDILGREVEKLIDEEKLPGQYEVQFDAKGLASGVYFYSMQAGSYYAVKKLVVLK